LVRIDRIDDLLKADLSASLAGLSLAAAAFLYGYKHEPQLGNSNQGYAEVEKQKALDSAKKDLIFSFFFLVICTLLILGFDMVQEGLIQQPYLDAIAADIIAKYGLFFAGLYFLGKGAFNLYRSLAGGPLNLPNDDVDKVINVIKGSAMQGITVEDIAHRVQIKDKVIKVVVKDLEESHKIEKAGNKYVCK
jgi:hypothetical protein